MATTTDDFRRDRRTGANDRRLNSYATPAAASGGPVLVSAAPTDGMRVSWGGIWGGVLAAVGIMLLLTALGVAIGITAADPQSTDARTAGTAAGLYAIASLLVALFVGGLVSTRIGAIHDRATGFWEGALVWVVSVLMLAWLAASGVSNLVGGAFTMMGDASQAMGTVLSQDLQGLQQQAAEAKPQASRAAWITFGGFVLTLLATIAGALVGRRREPLPVRHVR